ncbi:nuclear transport factor 2 family protein [Lysobacter sp. 2RAF19]
MRRFLKAVAIVLVLASCARTPPEQSLRRTIAQMQTAIQTRDASALADGIARDFIGPDGMDRKAAQRLAAVVFLQNRQVGVTLGPLDIKLQPGGATVHCTAAMTGGDSAWLPTSGQVYEVTTQWRQDGEDWELVSAEWAPRL